MTGPIRILYLEDNESDYELVRYELNRSKMDVELLWARNEAEYTLQIKTRLPDLVLCDHNLHGYKSDQALKYLKDAGYDIPFILVTATISEREALARIMDGMADYILKDRLQRLPLAVIRTMQLVRVKREKEVYYEDTIRKARKFRALIEHSYEGVLLCDRQLRITYVSPAVTRMSGFTDNELLNTSLPGIIDEVHLEQVQELISTVTEAGSSKYGTFRLRTIEGAFIWIEAVISNHLEDPAIASIVFNIHDISGKRAFEISLRRSESILSSIINNSEIAYVLVDAKFEIVTFNEQATLVYGQEFGRRPVQGAYIFDYLPQERREPMKAEYQRAILGEKFRYELSFVQPDGRYNWYYVSVFPVYNELAKVFGFVIATENITNRKNQEIEKEKLNMDLTLYNRNLQQFAFMVSHDLRAPVAQLLGLSQLLNNGTRLNEAEERTCIEGIRQCARQVDMVIRDLNDVLHTNNLTYGKFEEVRLPDVLQEIMLVTGMAGRDDITVKTDLQVPALHSVRSYIHSILINLMTNSLKYRKEQLQLQISIRSTVKESGQLLIEFEDNGIGLDLTRFGDKVFGLHKQFHTNSNGKGMGLFMVKSQVELLGGSIELMSRPGCGCRFAITLPATAVFFEPVS